MIINRALVRTLRSVGADFRFLNSLVSFIHKDIEFLIKSVGAKAPFQKFVGAAAPAAPTLTRALGVHSPYAFAGKKFTQYRALVSVGAVGAAAPTDFWNSAFASTLFIKNSISLLIKLTREFKNLKSAPTDLKILTRALYIVGIKVKGLGELLVLSQCI